MPRTRTLKKQAWVSREFLAFLLVVVASAIVAGRLYDGIRANARREQAVIAGGCQRLNTLRAATNRSVYADYRFFTLTNTLLVSGLKHPDRPQTQKQRQTTVHYINSLERDAADKEWTPLTICSQADNSPFYKAPEPIPFTAQTPTRADLFTSPATQRP